MAGETAYIRRAYTMRKKTATKPETMRLDGYDLFINGEWHERYDLARDAKAAAEAMGARIIKEETFYI